MIRPRLASIALAAAVAAACPGRLFAADLLVKGATLHTVSKAGTFTGDLLVRDGRIVAVVSDISAPRNAVVIDAVGLHVTPGLIDCHSHAAIEGGVNEGSNNVTAEVRIDDVIEADDVALYRQLAGGLTTANLLHGSANSIGGQNTVIKLRWGASAEDLVFDGAPPGIKFALGENPKRSNFNAPAVRRYPTTRMGVEQSIRERFLAAEAYAREWDEYESASAGARKRMVPPRTDLQLQAIAEILRGERLVHSHSYRQDEILTLLRLAEEFKIRIATFQHVLEGYKVADEMASHGAGGSTFSDWWAYKLEAYDAIPYNGALMAERGVVVSFNSDSDELARRMNLEAAKAIKYGGLPDDEALRFVTINPAIQLGIADRVGSLEPGKDADFVIWSGNPLSVYSIALETWIDGVKIFDRGEDLARREAILARRAELIEKVRAEAEKGKKGKDEEEGKATDDAEKDATPVREIPAARPLGYILPRATDPMVAIVGGTAHTVSGPDIENATILIEGGLITSVGPGLHIPQGARVIRAEGLHVYPGLIDIDTAVGLTEIGSVAGGNDVIETGKINPGVRAEVAVNPESELIPVTRANGITHVLTAPAGGIISGTSALIRLDGWTWEEMAAAAPAAMHVDYPAYPREEPGFSLEPPKSKEEKLEERKDDLRQLAETFEAARAYRTARSEGSGDPDPALEAMLPVLDGRIPVIVSASEVREIKEAVQWARREGVRMILRSAQDYWHLADFLAENRIPVIVGPVLSDNFREDEPYDTAYTGPLKLHEAGVPFCIVNGGDRFDAAHTRNLPYQAAMAAAFGLPRKEALKAVTLYPARILGVDSRLGSIEPGKSATLIITDGDPLEIRTHVLRELIDGHEVDLMNRHLRLYEKYRDRPRSLHTDTTH